MEIDLITKGKKIKSKPIRYVSFTPLRERTFLNLNSHLIKKQFSHKNNLSGKSNKLKRKFKDQKPKYDTHTFF